MAWPRWLLVAGFLAAFWLGTVISAPSVSPASQRQGVLSDPTPNIGATIDYGSVRGGDKDCGDFSSRAQAQAFFRTQGAGDPHRLDADSDGVTCER